MFLLVSERINTLNTAFCIFFESIVLDYEERIKQLSRSDMMRAQNIIPLGDHCCPALISKELGIRKYAYPFDWSVHVDEMHSSNLPIILSLLKEILNTGRVDCIIDNYLPLPPKADQIGKKAARNHVVFPHDSFWEEDLHEVEKNKYIRRARRLLKDILTKSNDYFVVSRRYHLTQAEINDLSEYLLSNKSSRLIIVTGCKDNENLALPLPGRTFIKYIPFRTEVPGFLQYGVDDYWKHDVAYWRPAIQRYLISQILKDPR